MTELDSKKEKFFANLPGNFILPETSVESRLLKEYGAMFVALSSVIVPRTVVFKDEAEVVNWQRTVPQTKETIGGFDIELQIPAMKSLKNAMADAVENDLTITPRGADAAKRNYSGTMELWASRVNPGLNHWVLEGKLSASESARIGALSPFEQVSEILRLEESGIFFSKDLSKSIVYSVAPPGTSQHISMLALDINEYDNEQICQILARHCWFQTVVSDLPHFTFLGASEDELAGLGLKKAIDNKRIYWVPDI